MGIKNAQPTTMADRLHERITASDSYEIREDALHIGGVRASSLVRDFGSPVYVVSDATLRVNYRRIVKAFQAAWPGESKILYAIKANNNLAIRAILSQEGAGSDCFGEAELYASLIAGTDPKWMVQNGSAKTREELRAAYDAGVTINIDNASEIKALKEIATVQRPARVAIRLKVVPADLKQFESDYFNTYDLVQFVLQEKWGYRTEAAELLLREIVTSSWLDFHGFHVHMGRIGQTPAIHAAWARAYGAAIRQLMVSVLDGVPPATINVGGGWARERDPESRREPLNHYTIEEYAEATSTGLLEGLGLDDGTIPTLLVESGRYIVGNAVTLLTRVHSVKTDGDLRWLHVDASTNNLMRVDTSSSHHDIVACEKMSRELTDEVSIVGPTCVHSVFRRGAELPSVVANETLAILDAGMYAETASTQFNGIPRPATVLVDAGISSLIKRRESIQDVFGTHIVPEHLKAICAPLMGEQIKLDAE